ncbi:FIG007785: exported protein [hydrothermal vent metagenome]|uniref:FIG007785: exported protein n=1 Tax=hydrothermal vent metagenome TaxID=652676 RepID=A0A3B0RN73_9ZZZZ
MGNGSKASGVIAGFVAMALATPASAGPCHEDQVLLRGDWGQARFSIELADDAEERAEGLMFRENLPKNAGMLFMYPEPKQVAFWMKNTMIPLDMIFLDKTGTVKRVHSMAKPYDTSPIFGGDDILAVLEINGGLAEALGITEGSELQSPAFDSDLAAWPC